MTHKQKGHIQEILPINHHQVHQTLQPLQRPGQPGPVRGYLVLTVPGTVCPGPLAQPVSHPFSSLHLAPPSSTLLTYHPLYLSPGAGRASLIILSWALRRPAPLQKKKKKKKVAQIQDYFCLSLPFSEI